MILWGNPGINQITDSPISPPGSGGPTVDEKNESDVFAKLILDGSGVGGGNSGFDSSTDVIISMKS